MNGSRFWPRKGSKPTQSVIAKGITRMPNKLRQEMWASKRYKIIKEGGR